MFHSFIAFIGSTRYVVTCTIHVVIWAFSVFK